MREGILAKFRIATPRGASFTTAGDYGYELEALTPIGAEIFEVPAGSEDAMGVDQPCARAWSPFTLDLAGDPYRRMAY